MTLFARQFLCALFDDSINKPKSSYGELCSPTGKTLPLACTFDYSSKSSILMYYAFSTIADQSLRRNEKVALNTLNTSILFVYKPQQYLAHSCFADGRYCRLVNTKVSQITLTQKLHFSCTSLTKIDSYTHIQLLC